MSDLADESLRPLLWMGNSKKDLLCMPPPVVDVFGYALYLAQAGGRHPDAKALQGFGGASVVEVVRSHDRRAYRLVYSVGFQEAVVVLHAFQKKSKTGIATPRPDIAVIRDRLKAARNLLRKPRT